MSLDDLPGDGPAGDNDNMHSRRRGRGRHLGNDVITGSALGNRLLGLGGDDTIDGGAGADIIDAGDGADDVTSRDGLAELVDCGDGVDTLVADDVDVTDGCENEQRSTLLQIDVDGDGAARPVDCNDSSAAIRPGAIDMLDDGIDQNCDGADATDLDRDRDGVPAPVDCDDGNPAAHPGARERRGNRVDEDCNGRAEPFELVTNGVPNAWTTQGSVTRNLQLGVRDVRRNMTIELRCRGGGCPFAKKTRRVKQAHPPAQPASAARGRGSAAGRRARAADPAPAGDRQGRALQRAQRRRAAQPRPLPAAGRQEGRANAEARPARGVAGRPRRPRRRRPRRR